ncbi:unnamed protein product, partial [Aphanomyces euteiches]
HTWMVDTQYLLREHLRTITFFHNYGARLFLKSVRLPSVHSKRQVSHHISLLQQKLLNLLMRY